MANIPDKLLPPSAQRAVARIGAERVYEIRLRAGRAATVNVSGEFHYMSLQGVSAYRSDALIFSADEIEQTVLRAAEYSLYAVHDQLVQSFVTLEGGIRVGVCGQTVMDGDNVRSVNRFGSVVIRIPHEIPNCSCEIAVDRGSVLIAGPPASGKTTILRDLARRCSIFLTCNVVVLDERGEIAACRNGIPLLDVGDSDVITDCDKTYGFAQAIRVLRPDVVVTDELMTESDCVAARAAMSCGIRIIASIHALNQTDLKSKRSLPKFDRVVWLSDQGKPGIIVETVEVGV